MREHECERMREKHATLVHRVYLTSKRAPCGESDIAFSVYALWLGACRGVPFFWYNLGISARPGGVSQQRT